MLVVTEFFNIAVNDFDAKKSACYNKTVRYFPSDKHRFYWPQRSCGQGYVFTRVCDSVYVGWEVCLSACWVTTPPRSRHPPTPQEADPQKQAPPRKQAPPSIRSMSGRYASYWNAFLSRSHLLRAFLLI